MKIVEINACATGSTGRVMIQIADAARQRGHEVITYSTEPFSLAGRPEKRPIAGHRYFGTYFGNFLHFSFAQLTDGNGFYSRYSTRRLLAQLKQFRPDIIHLHTLHRFCINLPILFRYIRKNHIRVVWTFHDCWAFTGHCCHYDMVGCEAWKTGCKAGPCAETGPSGRVFFPAKIWRKKKEMFSTVPNLQIVTPSFWLKNQVEQSFLRDVPVTVLPNGIDLSVFRPTPSDFRNEYGLQDKFVVLGVASGWDACKGLDAVMELATRLDARYAVILVGANVHLFSAPPSNVICIPRTENARQLAEIYSAADVFINPTREDTFPTVNMEALACGTPVVTFRTGGSPEILDETCGTVVAKNDTDALFHAVCTVCEQHPFAADACVARAQNFSGEAAFQKYVDLFESIV